MHCGTQQTLHKNKGFSLLEVLVVLVIIAISVKMVSYTFDDAEAEELEKQALKVHTVINLASEFAVLNQIELGFHIDKNVLEFLVFDGEKWTVFDAEALYEPITFGKEYRVNLNIEDLAWSEDNLLEQSNWRELMGTSDEDSLLELKKLKVPQVLILSSGEVSAFQLSVELADRTTEEASYFIEGEFIAPVNLRVEPAS